jgi:type VI secretion system protein ImpF
MAELSLKERLQPALLDRLTDDARYVTIFEITFDRHELSKLRLTQQDLIGILASQGLRRSEADADESSAATTEDKVTLKFAATTSSVSPAQLKLLVLKPPGAPQGITLQSCCTIEWHTSLNQQLESGEKGLISMRRLRESVQRDLVWLLNSASLDTLEDMQPYPQVARSVLNYGMPSFAGTALHSMDVKDTARRIREVIEQFEPRLSRVQVTPVTGESNTDEMTIAFRIEAELWGQPSPQHLVLKTSIDVESGDVVIGESSGA